MLCTLISRSIARFGGIALVAVGGIALTTGCETKSFLDPAQVGRWEEKPLVVPIMDNLSVGADEADLQFSAAREVSQEDLTETTVDYVISPNDLISITINDLVAPGTESTKQVRVSQTGKITLPLLPTAVQAAGVTEQQLEATIRDAYKDSQVINNAQPSVAVIEARGRTYSVLGAVGAPNLYTIYDTDFRLLDALVNARDVNTTTGVARAGLFRRANGAIPSGHRNVPPRRCNLLPNRRHCNIRWPCRPG